MSCRGAFLARRYCALIIVGRAQLCRDGQSCFGEAVRYQPLTRRQMIEHLREITVSLLVTSPHRQSHDADR